MRSIKWINVLGIVVGAAIMGFGINAFNIGNNLAEGGVTGIAILLKLGFDWDPGISSFVMNIPLFLIGAKILGLAPMSYTIFGSVCLSVFLWLFGKYRYPMDDLLLASLFAGLGVGGGLGIIFRFGGTTGGVDIIARIVQKYLGWKMGRTMLLADAVVLLGSLVYLNVQQIMYTLVAVFVGSRVIDFVQETGYSARAVLIMSDKGRDIAHDIVREMCRGATLLRGVGAYTNEDKSVVYVVVARSELVKLKSLIYERDPRAFVTVTETSEVLGEGFSVEKNTSSFPSSPNPAQLAENH